MLETIVSYITYLITGIKSWEFMTWNEGLTYISVRNEVMTNIFAFGLATLVVLLVLLVMSIRKDYIKFKSQS